MIRIYFYEILRYNDITPSCLELINKIRTCNLVCDNTPAAPRYINFFETILSWPVIHLVVSAGVFHISLWPQEIQPREWEKKNNEQTNNKGLGQLKVQEGEFCNTAFPVHL